MTTAELIPVLKSLRHNLSTVGVFADWFEERGDDYIARWLRISSASVFHGDTLLRLMQKHAAESTRRAIAEAISAEAFGRLNPEADDDVQSVVNRVVYQAVRRERPDTPPPEMWDVVSVSEGCSGPMVFPVMESTPSLTADAGRAYWFSSTFRQEQIHPRKFGAIETGCVTLDGLRLRVFAVVWHGRLSDGRVIMSRVRKEHLTPMPPAIVPIRTPA